MVGCYAWVVVSRASGNLYNFEENFRVDFDFFCQLSTRCIVTVEYFLRDSCSIAPYSHQSDRKFSLNPFYFVLLSH